MRVPASQSLGVVGLVLLGLWCLCQAAVNLGFLLPIALAGNYALGGWEWLTFAIYAVFGTGLVAFRWPLAGALFARSDDFEVSTDDVTRLQEFLLALLGIWFVSNAVVGAAHTEATLLSQFATMADYGMGGDRLTVFLSGASWNERIPYLVRGAIGLLLFFSAGNIVEFWGRTRAAGRRRDEPVVSREKAPIEPVDE